MDYLNMAIDRIHYLMERSDELMLRGKCIEARLLTEQAIEIAETLRSQMNSTLKQGGERVN